MQHEHVKQSDVGSRPARQPDSPWAPCHRWLHLVLLGRGIPASACAYQAAVIRSRLLGLAVLLAVLALLWIPLDAAYLAPRDFVQVLLCRVLLSLALAGVAWALHRHKPGSSRGLTLAPGWALAALIGLQCAAFAGMALSLSPWAPPLLRTGYGFFPFVVVAQLALFPLPMARAAALALPVLLIHLGMAGWGGWAMPWLSALWLLMLILSLACWAAGSQLSLLVELLSARDDAAHDALTGLANRRSALVRLAADLARAGRSGEAYSVLSFDLDHFKHINDRFGHAGGDAVLVALAGLVGEQLRASDLAARVGGEEFIVLLPAAPTERAAQVAERMREQLALASVPHPPGEPIRFTASVGVATWLPGESPDTLLARADAALYEAKNTGRNRVCVASGAVPSTSTA